MCTDFVGHNDFAMRFQMNEMLWGCEYLAEEVCSALLSIAIYLLVKRRTFVLLCATINEMAMRCDLMKRNEVVYVLSVSFAFSFLSSAGERWSTLHQGPKLTKLVLGVQPTDLTTVTVHQTLIQSCICWRYYCPSTNLALNHHHPRHQTKVIERGCWTMSCFIPC